MRSPCTATKSNPCSPQLEKARAQQRRPKCVLLIRETHTALYINYTSISENLFSIRTSFLGSKPIYQYTVCVPGVFTWMSHSHLQLNMSENELSILCLLQTFSSFSVSSLNKDTTNTFHSVTHTRKPGHYP